MQSSHRLRPPPVSKGAFRHGVPEPAGLFLLGQPDAICSADREVKRGTLSLACSPNTDADRSKNTSVSPPARTRRYAPCPTIGDGAWPLMESARQSSSDRRSHAKAAVWSSGVTEAAAARDSGCYFLRVDQVLRRHRSKEAKVSTLFCWRGIHSRAVSIVGDVVKRQWVGDDSDKFWGFDFSPLIRQAANRMSFVY